MGRKPDLYCRACRALVPVKSLEQHSQSSAHLVNEHAWRGEMRVQGAVEAVEAVSTDQRWSDWYDRQMQSGGV